MEGKNIQLIRFRDCGTRLLVLLMGMMCLTLVWTNPSCAWEIAKDKNGIAVYTRHLEGSRFKEYKAVNFMRSSLSSLVALVDDAESYPDWIHTCSEGKLLKRISERETYKYTINEAPWPVSDRDAVVHHIIDQNHDSGVITIHITGKPFYIAKKEGLLRVERIKGFWQFIPMESGQTKVIYQVHTEPGGSIPAWLLNSIVVSQPYQTILNMKQVIVRTKYQEAKYDFIRE